MVADGLAVEAAREDAFLVDEEVGGHAGLGALHAPREEAGAGGLREHGGVGRGDVGAERGVAAVEAVVDLVRVTEEREGRPLLADVFGDGARRRLEDGEELEVALRPDVPALDHAVDAQVAERAGGVAEEGEPDAAAAVAGEGVALPLPVLELEGGRGDAGLQVHGPEHTRGRGASRHANEGGVRL